jgi:predicted hydrocarbon binding protein
MLICLFYFFRARRARAVRRILEDMESAMAPPEVPNTPDDVLQTFSSMSVVVCHVQPDSAQSTLVGFDVDSCDMCATQRMIGAPICSKCGRGLFIVAKNVDLLEEDRQFFRALRDQVSLCAL